MDSRAASTGMPCEYKRFEFPDTTGIRLAHAGDAEGGEEGLEVVSLLDAMVYLRVVVRDPGGALSAHTGGRSSRLATILGDLCRS